MASQGDHWRALARLIESERARYTRLVVALAAASAVPLAGPLLVRTVVDRAAAGGSTTADIVVPATAYLVLALASQVVSLAVTWLATATAWRTANRVRLELTEHVLDLDLEFHRAHPPGELIQRVDGDITSVSDFLGRVVPKIGSVLLLAIGMVAVVFVLDWRLGLGFLLYAVIAGSIAGRTRDHAVGESVGEMSAYAELYGGIEERLTAGEDLRANRAGPHVMWRFLEDSAAALAASTETEKAFIRFWGRTQIAIMSGVALALLVSAALLDAGAITIGTTLLLVQYALMLRRPMEDVVDQFDVVQKASGAMVRVASLMDEQPKVLDTGTTSPPPGPLGVTAEHLGFHYGDGEPILTDLDIDIAPGRSVGLVGRTGGGKTTFTRLVLRLADPTSGTLRLGGVPITDIPLTELRHRVAMVPQEVHILAASVRDNITLFDHSIPDEQVIDALQSVGLTFLAEGSLDDVLGGEIDLSAGQQQLLALARIWLRDPDLVVLDEATARVDPATEVLLERAVAELIRGRTALIVAHRLSTLHAVDDICVVNGGRIVEFGERAALEQAGDSEFRRLLDLALEHSS